MFENEKMTEAFKQFRTNDRNVSEKRKSVKPLAWRLRDVQGIYSTFVNPK